MSNIDFAALLRQLSSADGPTLDDAQPRTRNESGNRTGIYYDMMAKVLSGARPHLSEMANELLSELGKPTEAAPSTGAPSSQSTEAPRYALVHENKGTTRILTVGTEAQCLAAICGPRDAASLGNNEWADGEDRLRLLPIENTTFTFTRKPTFVVLLLDENGLPTSNSAFYTHDSAVLYGRESGKEYRVLNL